MRGNAISVLALLCLLTAAASVARADEIRLKDGSKVIGTIVGFENDSFRVETSYGFALIRKDKVADINITGSKQDSDIERQINCKRTRAHHDTKPCSTLSRRRSRRNLWLPRLFRPRPLPFRRCALRPVRPRRRPAPRKWSLRHRR